MTLFRPGIEQLQAYIPGEQPQGGKFIKLNTNESPYPPPPSVVEAICAAARGGLQRYPDPLATAFRRRAAELHKLDVDWFLCGNGSDEILTILVRAFLGEGQLLRLPYPSYILYRTLAEIQGGRWEQCAWDDGWRLPSSLAAPAPDLRLVIVPNPNSPSGTCVGREELLALAERLPCPLVIDEAYADFAEFNCVDLVREHPRIIVTRTLSKSYALAGLRFGYAIAQPSIIEQLMKLKDSYNCDALSIAGAVAAIDAEDWLQTTRRQVIATRERMAARLVELGFQVIPSQANFVWCTHPTMDHRSIYEQLKQQQVLVRFMNFPGWGHGLRISVGTDPQIDAALLLLERIVQQAVGR
jgi:histidinol-phosphate aminotransferase